MIVNQIWSLSNRVAIVRSEAVAQGVQKKVNGRISVHLRLKVVTAAFLLLLAADTSAQDHLQFGQPDCPGALLDKQFFVLCHNSETKIPDWVGYALTSEDLEGSTERTDDFRPDPELPVGNRAELDDYRGSGYDRGHMAPAADFVRSEEAMSTSFLLSNMAPQTISLNRGRWAQLEAAARELASECDVWIFTGPIFIGGNPIEEIGENGVDVPTHFYKVILCVHEDDSKEAFASIMPNITGLQPGLENYSTSVDNVEELTGLDFWGEAPASDQEDLEAEVNHLP